MNPIPKDDNIACMCVAAFQFLCDDYGFGSPQFSEAGCERNLYFTKGNRTIGINWEWGAFPLVELFCPTVDIEHRRIPHIRPSVGRGKHALNVHYPHDVAHFLEQYAEALRAKEEPFLLGHGNA